MGVKGGGGWGREREREREEAGTVQLSGREIHQLGTPKWRNDAGITLCPKICLVYSTPLARVPVANHRAWLPQTSVPYPVCTYPVCTKLKPEDSVVAGVTCCSPPRHCQGWTLVLAAGWPTLSAALHALLCLSWCLLWRLLWR